MSEDRMSSKQYAKFEKVFFLYGSTVKLVENVRLNEWQPIAEQIWAWAIVKVDALVTECSQGFLEPPPDLSGTEPPVSDVATNGTNPRLKAKLITVKAVEVLKNGETRGRKWTATKIIDTDNVVYTTFAGHRYTLGKEYAIEYEEVQRGEYVDFRIKEPK